MWKCIVFSQIASNFLEEGPSNPWPPPPPPPKNSYGSCAIQSAYIQSCMNTSCPNNMSMFFTLSLFIGIITISVSSTRLTRTFYTYLFFYLLSHFLCKPWGTRSQHQERKPEDSSSHPALTLELSLQGAGEKQWEAWSISDSESSAWKIERGRTAERGGQRKEE